MTEHYHEQAECRDALREPLSGARAHVERRLRPRQHEHRVCQEGPETASEYLHEDVGARLAPGQSATQRLRERHGGVEVRPAKWREERNQNDEHRYGGRRVGQKRDRSIPCGQALGHDSGADHGRREQHRSDSFRSQAPDQTHCALVGLADRIQVLLELDPIERVERQTREDLDAIVE